MKTRPAILLALFLAGPVSAAPASDTDAITAAATGFYGVYQSLGLSDGIPDARARARFAPYLSDDLADQLAAADAVQRRFSTAHKDAPPPFEGDLFTSLFEGATHIHVGACEAAGARGRCSIALEYDAPGQKPQTWTDTILLIGSQGTWKVDDIAYGGAWDFANKGTLRETLKSVLADLR